MAKPAPPALAIDPTPPALAIDPTPPDPGLYLVATPIGHMRDMTLRALDVLAGVDLLACEDTRTTAGLLRRYGIAARRVAYHEHNAARVRPRLLAALEAGRRIALVSEAGTPLISDPGASLVREALARDLPVTALPGANAALAALSLSGLAGPQFFFAGFLPAKRAARKAGLAGLVCVPGPLIFHESPRRLAASLADMAAILGDRRAAVARELTKLHEEVRRAGLADLAAHYAAAGPPRGEVTLVVEGPAPEAAALSEGEIDAALAAALDAERSLRDAVDAVTPGSGWPRRGVYRRALALARQRGAAR